MVFPLGGPSQDGSHLPVGRLEQTDVRPDAAPHGLVGADLAKHRLPLGAVGEAVKLIQGGLFPTRAWKPS